jgi:hypothetical protein
MQDLVDQEADFSEIALNSYARSGRSGRKIFKILL